MGDQDNKLEQRLRPGTVEIHGKSSKVAVGYCNSERKLLKICDTNDAFIY